MSTVAVDADNRTARISGGARAADVLAATDPQGLAAVTGTCGGVGMAGLTLGGGYGPLIARYGLALDNLLGAEVVVADGRIVRTQHDSDEELFWALRGGGGNFGVVTAMQHRLHDLSSVCSGLLLFPLTEARAVLERCTEIAASAPEELAVQLGFFAGPDGSLVVFVAPTWCGAPHESEARVAPFLKLGTLRAGGLKAEPFGAALAVFDSLNVNGQRTFVETCSIPALDDLSIDIFIEAAAKAVSSGCMMATHEFRGAASRVPVEATAFGLRCDHVLVEIIAKHPDRPDEAERHQQWARATRHAFDAVALPGGYPNLLARSDAERAAASYGPNSARLTRAKRHYDPENMFRSAVPLPAPAELGNAA
jgi:FAD/FMN-containing dehydrogenase